MNLTDRKTSLNQEFKLYDSVYLKFKNWQENLQCQKPGNGNSCSGVTDWK